MIKSGVLNKIVLIKLCVKMLIIIVGVKVIRMESINWCVLGLCGVLMIIFSSFVE